jgi:hypothetical protein
MLCLHIRYIVSSSVLIKRLHETTCVRVLILHSHDIISWGHYATTRKVAGSIPDEVTSSRTLVLGSTQPLIEMNNRNLRVG